MQELRRRRKFASIVGTDLWGDESDCCRAMSKKGKRKKQSGPPRVPRNQRCQSNGCKHVARYTVRDQLTWYKGRWRCRKCVMGEEEPITLPTADEVLAYKDHWVTQGLDCERE